MRLAYIIIDCDGRDGTAIAMTQVMHLMAERGHEVHLFSDTAHGANLSLVNWHRVWAAAEPSFVRFATFFIGCSRKVKALRKSKRFDVIHSAGGNTVGADVYQVQNIQPAKREALAKHGEFVAGGSWLRRLSHRAYDTITTMAEERAYRSLAAEGALSCARVIRFAPVSHGVSRDLQTYYGTPAGNIDIVPNGVDLNRFRPRSRDETAHAIRAEFRIQPDHLMLLFTGGEWRRKGLHHAIRALSQIRTPHHSKGAVLVIAGIDKTRREFESIAVQLGVQNQLRFIGFSESPEQLMAVADVFLFPTYYEAFSLATLEASAAGLPIVAAPVNGVEELIRPQGLAINSLGENGILVAHTPASVAAAINTLAEDPHMMRRLGERGREIVEAEYGWGRVADAMERVYQKVVSKTQL